MPASDQLYQQVSESIKLVFDLTSRIDERVKILVEQHNDANQKIERLIERHENILSRISVLENKNGNGMREDMNELKKDHRSLEVKVAALEIGQNQHENKWKVASDFAFKVIVTLICGVIAWKLGIK